MSPYKPGDKIRRKDGREFPDGQLVAEVVERPGRFGSDRWPRVWIKDGQWVDTSDVEAYVEPPEPIKAPELTREQAWAPYGGDPMHGESIREEPAVKKRGKKYYCHMGLEDDGHPDTHWECDRRHGHKGLHRVRTIMDNVILVIKWGVS